MLCTSYKYIYLSAENIPVCILLCISHLTTYLKSTKSYNEKYIIIYNSVFRLFLFQLSEGKVERKPEFLQPLQHPGF